MDAVVDIPVEQRARMRRVLEPNFFLAGAARAGSTSLVDYLQQHPDVFMPSGDFSRKEPEHFCDPTPPWPTRYKDFDEYLTLFADAGDCRAIGEGSVRYLATPSAAERIYGKYPDAKIVIILRNSADRAYSWYTCMCQLGLEWEATFEKALADEQRRADDPQFRQISWVWQGWVQYFRFGLYADDIERFVRRFPRHQMHFLLFEDLKERPRETIRSVFEFLDVDPEFIPRFEIKNPTRLPLFLLLQYWVTTRTRLPEDRSGLPQRWRDQHGYPAVNALNLWLGQFWKRRLRTTTRRALLERYRDDIRRTGELIGRDLSRWFTDAGLQP
jgi:hypothetical protein